MDIENSIYASKEPEMHRVMDELLEKVEEFRNKKKSLEGKDPVEHSLGRIKDEKSMREKCRRKGLPETCDSALNVIHDAIGIRVVCDFVSDVYAARDFLLSLPEAELINEKDYIKHAKPNGYRSLHLILKYKGFFAEAQIRTISMDMWAALEHQMKYKHNLSSNEKLIVSELKRCADELAGADMTMQTLHDMIKEDNKK